MTAVYLIRSTSFSPLVKICATDCDEFDVLFAHREVFGDATLEYAGILHENQTFPEPFITDEGKFREQLAPKEYLPSGQPLRVPRNDVWNICGADDEDAAAATTAVPPDASAQQRPAFFKLCSVIEFVLSTNESIRHRPFIITNRKHTYDMHHLVQIFPEFKIFEHDRFPEIALAEKMLSYLVEMHGPVSSTSVMAEHVDKVRRFFGVGQNPVSAHTSILDPTCPKSKRLIIREFAAFRCRKAKGYRIKSSELYRHFEAFYEAKKFDVAFEKAFTVTQFSQMMKTNSVFRTKRKGDGMYWENLQIMEIPIASQTCAGLTFVNFDIRGTGKSLLISELFA